MAYKYISGCVQRFLDTRVTMLRNAVAVKHCVRRISTTLSTSQNFNEPLSGHQMPRAGGIASMMRLPVQENCDGLHACFVGVPLDIGTSNRSGTRFGPRQIRAESSLLRKVNIATDMAKIKVILSKMALRPINSQGHLRTRKARKKEEPGASPFDSFQVADIGDVSLNLYNLTKACEDIRNHFLNIVKTGCIPLALGGDHTMTYPILQAIKEKHGPVGLVHIDAHADINDTMLGEKIAHGTSFRRAMEDGCLDGHRVIQIGLRGSGYTMSDFDWAKQQGFRQVLGNECWNKSLTPLMAEVREMMGDRPVYISFDIDGLDPAFAPGTGTPEIAGLTPAQGLEIIRGCRGLNIVGCDLVEVSPPYDMAGTTALTGANLLFEMLCVLPEVKYLT